MVAVGAFGYFVPIFAFLLVFIVVYALMKKTGVLGGSEAIMLFVSLILAAFFVVEASLVEFVRFSSAWFSVLIIGLFFLLVVLAFLPGAEPLAFLTKNNWFSWAMLGVIIAFFVISSAYVFNWAVNWAMVGEWANSEWFGMILLLIIAAVVAWKIKG
jgi:hypothetical protein|tara:strand:- start:16 stop:486 length:471 start_codon:yes stop_codon:yes gene_type:complete